MVYVDDLLEWIRTVGREVLVGVLGERMRLVHYA